MKQTISKFGNKSRNHGWHNEPSRHSLAAKGIRTRLSHSNSIHGLIYSKPKTCTFKKKGKTNYSREQSPPEEDYALLSKKIFNKTPSQLTKKEVIEVDKVFKTYYAKKSTELISREEKKSRDKTSMDLYGDIFENLPSKQKRIVIEERRG